MPASASEFDWPDLVRRCVSAATVEAVYGPGGRRRGGRVRMHCPWHPRDDQGDPRDMRLSIDPATLGWRCFHGPCGRSGDALSWCNGGAPVRGPDFRAAAVRLADKVGVPVPDDARRAAAALADASGGSRPAKSTTAGGPEKTGSRDPVSVSGPRKRPQSDAETTARETGTARARRIWERATTIPLHTDHPARLWAGEGGDKWGVWAGARPWPDAIRWAADSERDGGRLVACIASLGEWIAAWPGVPVPRAVHTICVDGEGNRARDHGGGPRGFHKRTIGPSSGAGVLIGGERGEAGKSPLYVCEGVADALALGAWIHGASRAVAGRCGEGTASAFAILGTSGFRSGEIAAALAGLRRGVVVCGDRDSAGSGAAAALAAAVQDRGGRAAVWTLAAGFAGEGGYDPADLAHDRAYEIAERDAIERESARACPRDGRGDRDREEIAA